MEPAAGTSRGPALPEVVIRPPGTFAAIDLRELWRYRGTLYRKVRQRIRVSYDDMLLGFFWAVARPVIMVLVFTFFRNIADANVGVTIAYPLYLYSGLVTYYFFSEAASRIAGSLRTDSATLKKVYYPRLISPLTFLFSNLYDLCLAIVPLAIMMIIWSEAPGANLLLLPLVIGQLLVLTLGIGLVFSALSLSSRDWDRFLKFALYVGLWASPVIYATGRLPESLLGVYRLNPMVGTLDAVRAVCFGHYPFPTATWLYASAVSVVLLVVGLLLFQRCERTLVDRL